MLLKAVALNLLILGPLQSWAQVIVSVSPENDLIIKAKSCDILLRQYEALCQWKRSLDPGFTPTEKPRCRNKTLRVSQCLPEFTKAWQEKKLFHHGPNCWGTAMSFKGLSKKPRFLWSEEMEYWQQSPLCRKLAADEPKLPGDIINVYSPEHFFEDRLGPDAVVEPYLDAVAPDRVKPVKEPGYTGYHWIQHSVTWISPELVFGKDSPSKDDKFYYHPIELVYGRPRSPECQENQTLLPHKRGPGAEPVSLRDTKCPYFSEVRRCQNVDDYFNGQVLEELEKEVLDEVRSLMEFQQKLFTLVVNRRVNISKNEQDLLEMTASIHLKLALEKLKTAKKNSNLQMLATLQYFTAAGIVKSLEQALEE